MYDNDKLISKALTGAPLEKIPKWMMRQAGRYLPEYREVRAQAGSFVKLMKNPELACEVTLQPLQRFNMDGAIIFSDILTIPDAAGLGLEVIEKQGPRLQKNLQTEDAILQFEQVADLDLDYVYQALTLCRSKLPAPQDLIGFAGSPFTLACYMIEGAGGDFFTTRKMLYQRPDLFARIIKKNTELVAKHLIAQAKAGADVLMLFDSWAGLLNHQDYLLYCLEPLTKIADQIAASSNTNSTSSRPLIYFARAVRYHYEKIAKCKIAAIGIDWQTDPLSVRKIVGEQMTLQGNLDPSALLANPEQVYEYTMQNLQQFHPHGQIARHIFNLGHGIDKRTAIESVQAMSEAVDDFSAKIKK